MIVPMTKPYHYRWGSPAVRAALGIGKAGVVIAVKPSTRRGRNAGGSHEGGRSKPHNWREKSARRRQIADASRKAQRRYR